MAVKAGWVGSSAKAETGKAWMGDARVALRLSRAGWMSQMVGRSVEVKYTNTTNRKQANIHTLMGSPTVANIYIFENTATISAASAGGWALRTGSFPAGSTLKIVNKGYIRGGGGNGGNYNNSNGQAGGTALYIDFPVSVDNTSGGIYGGGGGGAGGAWGGGGGGAGMVAGAGGSAVGTNVGVAGTATAGGRSSSTNNGGGGKGGGLGAAGSRGAGATGNGGRGGYSVQRNGHAVTWTAVGDRKGSVV